MLILSIFNLKTPWFIDLICKTTQERDELSKYLNDKNILTRDSYRH